MVDKFNNIFFLIVYFAHFIIVGSYAFKLVFDTKKFLKNRGVDKTATLITRFAGSFMIASLEFAGEFNGEVTYSLTLESSGAITFS